MSSPTQLTLSLDLPTSWDSKDFIVTGSNKDAFLWLERWPNWPNRSLSLYGPRGSGKTHLGNIWKNKIKPVTLTGEALNHNDLTELLRSGVNFIVDNADALTKDEKLFHLYNHVKNSDGFLLLLSEKAPAHWDLYLPDLRSRLNAIPSVKISPPDDALLAAVIQKQFLDLQLRVEHETIAYIIKHIERSFQAATNMVSAINDYALTNKKPITLPLARQVLLSRESF